MPGRAAFAQGYSCMTNRHYLHQSWRHQAALAALQQGELIAYPTEAVWGLGCDPWSRDAVEQLLALKAPQRR